MMTRSRRERAAVWDGLTKATKDAVVETLSALPGKGCVLTVVLPAYVVPTEAERVDVTLGCVRERERIIGGMPGVLEAQLGGIGVQALGAHGGHVDEIRRLDGPFRALAIEDDRRRFDAKELPDEARQGSHRAAGRAAGDSRHRVALLGGGARVRDEADRPVAFAHLLRRQTEDYEAEAVKRDGAVGPAFDLRSEEHTSELQSRFDLVCRLLLEKKKTKIKQELI